MTRCQALRAALNEKQKAFGVRLGISQAHVSRIEAGERCSVTLELLMDAIAERHGLQHLTSAAFEASSEFPAPAGPDVSAPQGAETVTTVSSASDSNLRDMPDRFSVSPGVSSLDCPGAVVAPADAGAFSRAAARAAE